jgi:two-component system response regulator QseB
MQILLVEDDELLGDAVRRGLMQEHYTVEWVRDGLAARSKLRRFNPDLLLLDLNLPQCSGLEVLRNLRALKNSIPVLILTARDTVSDRVTGLDAGADDYLIKPFSMDELYARVRALMRRSSGRATPVIEHGDITLDPVGHGLTRAGEQVEVQPKEFAILKLLLENAGKVLSRTRLEEALYGWSGNVGSNAVEVHVHHLRKKLGKNLVRTVRGVGYIIPKPKT